MAKKWLSVAEIAEELGLSDDTIRDWRIKREDLDKFLEQMKNVREDEDDKP